MNTEKPMNTEDTPQADDHDPAFDRRLGMLYQVALLDEKRQQQIAEDFQALPEAGKALLKQRERCFVDDEPQLSAAMRDKLLARVMDESGVTPASQPKATVSPPWWKTLFGDGGLKSMFLPGGMVGIPLASIAGVVVGSVVTVLILQESPPTPEFQTRSGDTPADTSKPPPKVSGAAITDDIRKDPDLWWAAIMDLQQQPGKLPEAIDEMTSFNHRYPNYVTKSR